VKRRSECPAVEISQLTRQEVLLDFSFLCHGESIVVRAETSRSSIFLLYACFVAWFWKPMLLHVLSLLQNAFHSNIFLSILPALYYVEICEALTDYRLLVLLSVSMLSVNATLTLSWRHCCPCFGLSMDCCTWRDVSLSPSDTSLYIGCRRCRSARLFCLYTTAV
jgi:hypothetical protein